MGKIDLHLAIDADLAAEAERRGVVLDEAAEAGIRQALERQLRPLDLVAAAAAQRADPAGAAARAKQWAIDNAAAIKRHNEAIAERGVFGDDLRTW
jgi:post-segregation antitoxin (ccd killing protein)